VLDFANVAEGIREAYGQTEPSLLHALECTYNRRERHRCERVGDAVLKYRATSCD
jgi:hypothetical protein